MPEKITFEQLLMIALFVLPGSLSMYVYGLKVPQKDFLLKDRIAEAIFFSLLNFIVVGPLVWALVGMPIDMKVIEKLAWWQKLGVYFTLIIGFVVMPVVWAFGAVWLLRAAQSRRWISSQTRSAWDAFFANQRTGSWVIVTMNDNSMIGGKFGTRSFASAWPAPGHLFLEELWAVNTNGQLHYKITPARGILLRPADYKFVCVE